ncbi:hypothetical protein GGX14DRAFT_391644 [Mycena pura]|uniref:DUF6570 domain-containing protein n=1 Tax=Mycena pura TaxID=153505 RepID=A0AAD6VKU8_9AGAR|nr:hypothetical protein GGX14DRAFT_391644 [Mycena pura]
MTVLKRPDLASDEANLLDPVLYLRALLRLYARRCFDVNRLILGLLSVDAVPVGCSKVNLIRLVALMKIRWLDLNCLPPPMPFDDGSIRDLLLDPADLKRKRMPALSLANRTFGPVRPGLKYLTVIEEAMIARCRLKCWIIQLKEENQDLILQSTQRGIKGHIIVPYSSSSIKDSATPPRTPRTRISKVDPDGKSPEVPDEMTDPGVVLPELVGSYNTISLFQFQPGDKYPPDKLSDHRGPYFAHNKAELVRRDYTDKDGKLIAPEELYATLTEGTLVLVVSLATYPLLCLQRRVL